MLAAAWPALSVPSAPAIVRTLLTADDVPGAVTLSDPKPLGIAAFGREANGDPEDRARDAARLREAGFETAAVIRIVTSAERDISVYSVEVRHDAARGLAQAEAASARDEAPKGIAVTLAPLKGLPSANVLTYRLTTGSRPILGIAVVFARGPYVGLVGVTGEETPPKAYVVKLARRMDARIRAVA